MAIIIGKMVRGLPLEAAYVRIDTIHGGKRDGNWTGQVGLYATQAAAEAGHEPLETWYVDAPYDPAQGPYASLYAALKARPDMEGAVDC